MAELCSKQIPDDAIIAVLELAWGQGLYFGKFAWVAHPYSIPGAFVPERMEEQLDSVQKSKNMNIHTMLLCRIIFGRQQKGYKGQTAPSSGYDSTIGSEDGLYYILFNSKRILPVAIIAVADLGGEPLEHRLPPLMHFKKSWKKS